MIYSTVLDVQLINTQSNKDLAALHCFNDGAAPQKQLHISSHVRISISRSPPVSNANYSKHCESQRYDAVQ